MKNKLAKVNFPLDNGQDKIQEHEK